MTEENKTKKKINLLPIEDLQRLKAELYPPEPREHNVGRLRRIHNAALNFSKVIALELNGEARFEALANIRQATRAAMMGIQTEKLQGRFYGGGSTTPDSRLYAAPEHPINKAPIDRRGLAGGL